MPFARMILIRLVALAVAGPLPGADTPAPPGHRFRVEGAEGVPQLVMDGRAIRPRIFFGQPEGVAQVRIGPTWKRIDFTFVATEDDPIAALHLRFGEESGDVWLDALRVVDETAGVQLMAYGGDVGYGAWEAEWRFWCQGRDDHPPVAMGVAPGQGVAGGAAWGVHLTADARLQGFHLFRPQLRLAKDHRYRTVMAVRASGERSFRPSFHHQEGDFHCQGGLPSPYADQVRMAADAGIDLVSFITPGIWVEPGGVPDYRRLDRACRMTLAANPGACLLVRVSLNAPAWWVKAHPDDAMGYEGGAAGSDGSVASPVYRDQAVAALRCTIRYCEEHFRGHMAGYHPAGQNTDEWFYQRTWEPALNGYEPATRNAWRAWLRGRYRTDAALRAAWNRPAETLDQVQVPTPAERHAAASGCLRDPSREQHLLDFAAFQQEGMADMVCTLARSVREEAGADRLSVFFYGYLFEFAGVANGPAVAGHYALTRLLASPDIDILCSPISYHDRQTGGAAPCMSAGESVALAGKLWLNEDDTFTYLAAGGPHPPGWQAGAATLAGTVQQLRRNLAQESCRNFATWWMDLCGTGWFQDPRLWQEMERFKAMDAYFLAHPTPFRPEVAAVVDERAMTCIAAAGASAATSGPLVSHARVHLHRLGAPCGQYLLDDVLAGRVNAKLQVFLAAWSLTARERAQLTAATRAATTVWCWAPGYLDGDARRGSLEAVAELTGFSVTRLPEGLTPRVRATPEGLAAGLPAVFGTDRPVSPLLSPATRAGDVVLAVFPGGQAAVVVRQRSVFVATTDLPSALLRHIARLAGVHLYTASDANVYANGPFLAIHACADGPLEIDLGAAAEVQDESTGASLGRATRLVLPMAAGETRVLRLRR